MSLSRLSKRWRRRKPKNVITTPQIWLYLTGNAINSIFSSRITISNFWIFRLIFGLVSAFEKLPFIQKLFSPVEQGDIRSSVFALFSGTVGAGLMSLPQVFSYFGLGGGIIVTLFNAFLAYTSFRALFTAIMKSGKMRFPNLVNYYLGRNAARIFAFCIVAVQFFNMTIYVCIGKKMSWSALNDLILPTNPLFSSYLLLFDSFFHFSPIFFTKFSLFCSFFMKNSVELHSAAHPWLQPPKPPSETQHRGPRGGRLRPIHNPGQSGSHVHPYGPHPPNVAHEGSLLSQVLLNGQPRHPVLHHSSDTVPEPIILLQVLQRP